jgi:hypothetical protein
MVPWVLLLLLLLLLLPGEPVLPAALPAVATPASLRRTAATLSLS